jgi:antitoxin (DNA-binding transcriptional repressor) of toxin-antitoxin stability system
MTKASISVTDAARNFAECVNRVRYQNATFVLLKNGVPVANLVPNSEKVCTGRDLAEVLAGIGLRDDEAKAWRRELRSTRKTLKVPADRWR